jgi:uncharacterized protein YcbX
VLALARSLGGGALTVADSDLDGLVGDRLRTVVDSTPPRPAAAALPGHGAVHRGGLPAALESALERHVDLRRFRPNLHLELDSAPFRRRGVDG